MPLALRPEFAGQEPYGAPQLDVPVVLNTNENPYPPADEVVAEIASRVADAAAGLNRYPDREALELRGELAGYLARESGVRLPASQIWAANGSNEVMAQILQAYAGPGRTVLTFTPSYSMYPEYARNVYSTFVGIERREDFSIDCAALADQFAQHRPAVVLIASPNNPTGTAVEPGDLQRILEASRGVGPQLTNGAEGAGGADRADAIVVVDEAYGEFRREGVPSALELLDEYPNLIVTRTMSKAFGAAGLRLGYMAASQEIIDSVRIVRLPYHLSAVSQAAALAALAHRDSLMEQVEQIRQERDKLASTLTGMGLDVAPSDANFIMFGTFADRHKVWQRLLDQGILIREVGPEGWLRVSIGQPHENEAFVAGLKEAMR
ncbi:histidinol-phosphate transaminase [Trueperella bialowiezensis]|uniref:Histidinol-phosphate aminotransferase n=1 Tax=Trueperella bialowiezensis TaxID=312285 RepID=A0A448PGS5_9ACTO|nr:histidinol-phosphate transaminase [Trueperella bialowiezensis]VEI14120.1 Histidinol-phosphate aminotransferase [Trueperella bialowiezensis]